MLTDKVTSILLGALLVLSLCSLAYVGIENLQLSNDLSETKRSLATETANKEILKASIELQNAEIDRLQEDSLEAAFRYEQAQAASVLFVEEEERRILGIRSAPPSEDYEQIRQKMLQDAML